MVQPMTRTARLEAVLFDMDGVIIDSEPLWTEAERRFLASRMLEYSPQLKTVMMGRDAREAVRLLIKHYRLREGVEEVIAERNQLVTELFKQRLQPIPNVLRLLRSLRESGIKTGLASSSPKQLVKLALDKLGITQLFEAIISGDQVARGKPAAEIYLAAAKKIGVDPANCLVIEDAPLGIAAAKAAGMRCLAISVNVIESELAEADRVVRGFDEVDVQSLKDLMYVV